MSHTTEHHEVPKRSVKKIKTLSIEDAWGAIRHQVGRALSKDGFIPVGYLHDAQHYDLGTVITKQERSFTQVLLFKKPRARPVCMLEDLLVSADNISQDLSLGMKRPQDMCYDQTICHVFEGSAQTGRTRKKVVLKLGKCKHQVLNGLDGASGQILDLWKLDHYGYRIDSLFLVSEVIYSQDLKMKVVIGNEASYYTKKIRWPLAFRVYKFPVLYDSVLGARETVRNMHVSWNPFRKLHVVRDAFAGDCERGFGDDMQREERRQRLRRQRERLSQLILDLDG